jgi:AP-3 complex subunit delta-1
MATCRQIDQQNIQSIIQQLLSHLLPDASNQPTAAQSLADAQQHAGVVPPLSLPSQSPAYRLVLARRILSICSKDTYDNVTNFEWYLSVLVDLAHIAGVDVGAEIQRQLVDVAGRVRGARRFAVQLMAALLTEGAMLREAGEEGSCVEVLWAAAWICGEYCRCVA